MKSGDGNPDFSRKRVLVVGLGVSGLLTARWLAGQNAKVTVSDMRSGSHIDPGFLGEMRKLGVLLETGGHKEPTFLDAEVIIVSPGVPHDMELLRSARSKDIPVMGETELASRLIDTPIIAVTGTNGKSTVTALLGAMLEKAGMNAFVGGNIGTPLIAYASGEKRADYVVLEVSSFQLDTIEKFSPLISIILNISPDHLDRYPSYEAYVRSKLGIFKNQGPGQYVILNDEDARLSRVKPGSGVSVIRYGVERKEGRHAFVDGKEIVACPEKREKHFFSIESVGLEGRHNLENLLSGVLVGLTLGLDTMCIQETLNEFRGLPDRLEKVAEVDGVTFYNDSKATNVDAAVRAVEALDRPLILIAGGRHKGAQYGPLVRSAEKRVKRAVFLGEARELLAGSFRGIVPFSMAEDIEEAVSVAFSWAKRGDAVLLAPACSSLDMFSDFSQRGRAFKRSAERCAHG